MAKRLEKQSISLKGVKVIGVTSPNRIAQIAEERNINPQEVFVRVVFEYQGSQYQASNQLRFFGEKGYSKLLESRDNETLVNVTITADDKGTLMYLDSDKDVSVSDLFKTPTATVAARKDLLSLF